MPAIRLRQERFRAHFTVVSWRAFPVAPRGLVAALAIGDCASIATATEQARAVDSSRQPIGSALRDFEFRRADESDWTIVREVSAESSLSIHQVGAEREARPSPAVYKPLWGMNAKSRVRSNLIDGSMPSAGFAVRVTSLNDCHLVRASAFEHRPSLLHVVHGLSEEIADVEADVTPNHWQGFKIPLDGQRTLTGFNHSTPENGQFGVWAEPDDVTRFNQIEISLLTYASNRHNLRGREEQDNDGVAE